METMCSSMPPTGRPGLFTFQTSWTPPTQKPPFSLIRAHQSGGTACRPAFSGECKHDELTLLYGRYSVVVNSGVGRSRGKERNEEPCAVPRAGMCSCDFIQIQKTEYCQEAFHSKVVLGPACGGRAMRSRVSVSTKSGLVKQAKKDC